MEKINRIYFPENICEGHGIFDVFPCPWPNCENGCHEEQFELVDDSTNYSAIYTRREWKSPFGDSYYSWDTNRLPNWFGLEKVVWMEARRLGIVIQSPDTVYHYTTLEGLKGIIESDCIWLSDFSYLNDSKELLYGIELTKTIASNMLQDPFYEGVQHLIKSWLDTIHNVEHRVCIASFSSDGDSLSQWRSYGNVAIGFESGYKLIGAQETISMPAIYCVDKQEMLIKLLLSHMSQTYAFDKKAGRLDRIEKVYFETDKIIRLISFFKSPGFKEEAEYRVAYLEEPKVFESVGQSCAPKKFRISANAFIPYVQSNELPGYKPDKLPICSVVLGPSTNNLLECGLRELLNANGYEKVAITKSIIPFRI